MNMQVCPKCNAIFDEGKWKKRFCSRKCANSRIFSAESLRKRSNSNKVAHQRMTKEQREKRNQKFIQSYRITKPKNKCIDCDKKIDINKYKRCRECFLKSDFFTM